MTYQETISFLYEHLPMFTRIGAAAYKKDLHNTLALLGPLGNPHKKFKSIHIAGTNGKGSTSHMLAAIFHANGYKTGLYTSPHLKDFRERIKVSGLPEAGLEMITESFVIDFVAQVKPLLEMISPSFFELTVAMAFEFFARQNVDIAVIETGLGGRLDSTNVIGPELSIITNIGWDHMNLLGESLELIAGEKAGIIKPNVPVVIGETLPETMDVFRLKANAENAPIFFAEDYTILDTALEIGNLEVVLKKAETITSYKTDLTGVYQQYNLRSVVTAVEVLKQIGWHLPEENTRFGLQNIKQLTGLHGRWEIISEKPFLVIDVGHNEAGIKQVLKQLELLQPQLGQVHIIIGMVADKEVDKVLKLFPLHYRYSFTNAAIPRAMPATDLKNKAAAFGLMGDTYSSVDIAIEHALQVASPNDLILVCGSVFVAGEVTVEKFQTAV